MVEFYRYFLIRGFEQKQVMRIIIINNNLPIFLDLYLSKLKFFHSSPVINSNFNGSYIDHDIQLLKNPNS